jgi:hypothetical protein
MTISRSLIFAIALGLPFYANAAEAPSAETVAAGHALDFVADVSKYQAMFDSVVAFCQPTTPANVLELARKVWLSKNQHFLDLRDRELARVIAEARANGAEPSKIAFLKDWADKQYQVTLGNNRMYKDLLARQDLPISCPKRLGEMNHSSMELGVISPRAVEYAESLGEP